MSENNNKASLQSISYLYETIKAFYENAKGMDVSLYKETCFSLAADFKNSLSKLKDLEEKHENSLALGINILFSLMYATNQTFNALEAALTIKKDYIDILMEIAENRTLGEFLAYMQDLSDEKLLQIKLNSKQLEDKDLQLFNFINSHTLNKTKTEKFYSAFKIVINPELVDYFNAFEELQYRISFNKNLNSYLKNFQFDLSHTYKTTHLTNMKNLFQERRQYFLKQGKMCESAFANFLEKIKKLITEIEENWNKEDYYIKIEDYLNNENFTEKIKVDLLTFVFEHNKKVFQKLLDENEEIRNSDSYIVEKSLIDNNIPLRFPSTFYSKNKNKLKQIAEIIDLFIQNKWLTTSGDGVFYIPFILENTTVDKVKNIIRIFKENSFKKEYAFEHMNIFTSSYDYFIRNINFSQKQKLIIQDFYCYLLQPEMLISRFNLAKAYGLNLREETSADMFLENGEAFNKIDKCIELGLDEKALRSSDKNIFKKTYILNALKMPKYEFINEEEINTYLDKLNQVPLVANEVYNSTLDISLNSNVTIKNTNLKQFDEKYKMDEYRYVIDGIIISRLKVIRCFNTLEYFNPEAAFSDILFQSIIYNSYLDLEKLNKIAQEIQKSPVQLLQY